jgi:perosamine synthetase
MSIRIPYAIPEITEIERMSLLEAFDDGQYSGSGKKIVELEKQLSEILQTPNVSTTSNGSSAIRLAFAALDVDKDTEVFVPGWGFHVAANIAQSIGASVNCIDVDLETWTIDLGGFFEKLNPRKKTCLIITHTLGNTPDLTKLNLRTNYPKLTIIEDAAEALFSSYKGNYLGTYGDAGTFSFHAAKTISTGEGGFCVFKSRDIHSKAELIKTHGMKPDKPYYHEVVGDNYRLSNLLAALAIPQLERRTRIIESRLKIYENYSQEFKATNRIQMLKPTDPSGFFPWGVGIRIIGSTFESNKKLRSDLRTKGVDTRPGFSAAFDLPYLNQNEELRKNLKNSGTLSNEIILLPHYPKLIEKDIEYISEEIINLIS